MNTTEILDIFFYHIYEDDVNEKLLDDIEFVIPIQNIKNFIIQFCSIPYSEFIDYIVRHKETSTIDTSDITQCSSLDACTNEMCIALLEDDNRGKTFLEIGKADIFKKYVHTEKDYAWRKYGENQVKTAEQLGLAFKYYNLWYLSCFGYAFLSLSELQKNKFLARTILRNKLYSDIITKIIFNDVDILQYMEGLSSSTKIRRSGSILKLLNFCFDEMIDENISFHDLYYPARNKNKKLGNNVLLGNSFAKVSENDNRDIETKSDGKINVYHTNNIKQPVLEFENINDLGTVEYYKDLFKHMRTSSYHNIKAPHKFILLLSVISLIDKGTLKSNKIILNKDLESCFNSLWNQYVGNNKFFICNIAMPFWHMKNEHFWHLLINKGYKIENITSKYSKNVLRKQTNVELDKQLFDILLDTTKRKEIKLFLIELLKIECKN